MNREQLRALGLTDEQIDAIMKQHGIDTQNFNTTLATKEAEITRLKGIETDYNNLLNNPKNKEPNQPSEPVNPELEKLQKQLAELQEENIRKDIRAYAIEKGISGDDAENVLKAFLSDLEGAKGAIDSIANIISAKETAAADAKVKELVNNTTNPNGGTSGNNNDTKPADVENAESITFATVNKNAQSARDFYK